MFEQAFKNIDDVLWKEAQGLVLQTDGIRELIAGGAYHRGARCGPGSSPHQF
jgi:hypothetical protein